MHTISNKKKVRPAFLLLQPSFTAFVGIGDFMESVTARGPPLKTVADFFVFSLPANYKTVP